MPVDTKHSSMCVYEQIRENCIYMRDFADVEVSLIFP